MTAKALTWIRKSKGTESDIGLEQQRESVQAVAEELAGTVETLDLGVQTGFSTLTRDEDAKQLLDEREDVQAAVEDLRNGGFDLIVAYDDRRVARDEYFSVIEHACVQGDVEMVFVSDDVEENSLAFDLQRRIERKTKEEEIKKSKAAIRERRENGCYQGTVPFGLTFAADKCHLERHDHEWDIVEEVIERRENGESVRAVMDTTGVPATTVSRIANRGVEWYEEKLQEYGV
ncbi:resolvase [Halomicroarcula sp. GCM10025324]|uniref:recombinase family protein n=1 Tax=Haloarcula TaxID=2237 RepID=UPI0023E78005|nr:recombinase family protein [Halomicroarcula sp. ZS-22-S1]